MAFFLYVNKLCPLWEHILGQIAQRK